MADGGMGHAALRRVRALEDRLSVGSGGMGHGGLRVAWWTAERAALGVARRAQISVRMGRIMGFRLVVLNR